MFIAWQGVRSSLSGAYFLYSLPNGEPFLWTGFVGLIYVLHGIDQETETLGASLVVQWLRTLLLMLGTWVRALVWEDPTCLGAAKPVSHNY